MSLEHASAADVQALDAVETADDCAADTLGWFFPNDASRAAPREIELCPAACDALLSAGDGAITLYVGCEP